MFSFYIYLRDLYRPVLYYCPVLYYHANRFQFALSYTTTRIDFNACVSMILRGAVVKTESYYQNVLNTIEY